MFSPTVCALNLTASASAASPRARSSPGYGAPKRRWSTAPSARRSPKRSSLGRDCKGPIAVPCCCCRASCSQFLRHALRSKVGSSKCSRLSSAQAPWARPATLLPCSISSSLINAIANGASPSSTANGSLFSNISSS
ncbi:unnamed protein product [Mycena citricolor]|uniref:Uncharacterized protein n=3 Tax=Mycena citricolor TaxID=2018698 RepID=A0AAD2HKT6_9AGAR|nr:unnamed protein product [Mycena citricolor]